MHATVAAPLTDLTRKSAPNIVQWSEACNNAFKELKDRLCRSTILSSPDFLRPFILQTDASDRGAGAVLSQIGEDGEEHPVGYYSRKFQPREERYSTVEKRVLSYKVSYQRISGVLIGKKIHDPNRSSLFGMAGPIKGEQPTSVSLEFITPALPI